MKELTFREVIANIKEGETWEGLDYTIIYFGGKIGIMYNDGEEYQGVYPKIDSLFKLRRKEYTFQEAFEAFEQGKEIESCETATSCYLKDDRVLIKISGEPFIKMNKEDLHFSFKQIKGKWYIND